MGIFSIFSKVDRIIKEVTQIKEGEVLSFSTPDCRYSSKVHHYIDIWSNKGLFDLVSRKIETTSAEQMPGWKGASWWQRTNPVYQEQLIASDYSVKQVKDFILKHRAIDSGFFDRIVDRIYFKRRKECILSNSKILIPKDICGRCLRCEDFGYYGKNGFRQYFFCPSCRYYKVIVFKEKETKPCNKCNASMLKRMGKFGTFWSCTNINCENTEWIGGSFL